MSDHNLLILCGGKGTRLASVWTKPKILAPIGDRNYLMILMDILAESGMSCSITLATGYKSADIEDEVKSLGQEVTILREDRELGTGGAVLNYLDGASVDRFTLMNGDTLYASGDLNAYFAAVSQHSGSLVAVKKVASNDRFGSFTLQESLRIEKPETVKTNDLVYAGLATLCAGDLLKCPERPISLEAVINRSQIPEDKVASFVLQHGFYDIGTPQALEKAEEWLGR